MAVTIDIDLNAKGATKKVERLRAQIQSLDGVGDDIDIGFADDLQEQVDTLEDFLDDLEDVRREIRQMDADFNTLFDGLDDAEISVGDPDGETGSTGGGTDPPRGESDGGVTDFNARKVARRIEGRFDLGRGAIPADMLRDMSIDQMNAEIAEFLVDQRGITGPRANLGANAFGGDDQLSDDGTFFSGPDGRSLSGAMQSGRGFRQMQVAQSAPRIPELPDMRETVPEHHNRRFSMLKRTVDSLTDSVGRFRGSLRYLFPSMQNVWRVIGAMIPALIAFGTQAAGAAAAMGGLAAAGAGVLALGLVGHGEDMEEAWSGAQDQVRQLGEDLFEVFQPSMQTMAPIQAEFFDWIPSQLDGVADALEGLQQYGPAIFELFDMAADGAETFINLLVSEEDRITQMGTRFAGILGGSLLDLFEWLINTGYENQDMLIQFGSALAQAAVIVYRLTTYVAGLVVAMTPLLNIFDAITAAISTRFGTAILGAIVTASALIKVLGLLSTTLQMLGYKGVIGALMRFSMTYTSTMAGAITMTMGLVAAVGLLTAGLSVLAGSWAASQIPEVPDEPGDLGGTGGTGYSGYGGGAGAGAAGAGAGQMVVNEDNSQTTINVQGDMDTFSRLKVQDEIGKVRNETEFMNPPATSSDSSDGS